MAKKIGIDPGHGGSDPGAVGAGGLKEKDITLAISTMLAKMLQSAGLATVSTRFSDTNPSLRTRTNLLNAAKADIAVSVHINASTNRDANYISTFIQGKGGEAERIAERVQACLVGATGWPDGGVRVQNLHMTRETNMPAILVECGFISNPEQEKKLGELNTRNNIARAIADGILEYLNIERSGDMDRVKVIVKDKEINGKLIDGQTYVPLRDLIEILNNKIVWDGKSKVARVE